MRTIVIGCDNAAVNLKNTLISFMKSKEIVVEDVGCFTSDDSTYYPYIAEKVCNNIIESDYKKHGVLICGTGLGMAITANKFKGIRAGVCHDPYSAERLKLSNNGNVLCMGERVIGEELAKKILWEWLNNEFVDSSSTPKIEAIIEIEDKNQICTMR